MEPSASIKAKRTMATATALMNTASAIVIPDKVMGRIVEPMATTTKNMEPMNSAIKFCLSVGRLSPPQQVSELPSKA